jgi:hypothetical protein
MVKAVQIAWLHLAADVDRPWGKPPRRTFARSAHRPQTG